MLINLRSPLMPLPPGSPVDQDGPEFPLMSSPGEPWGPRWPIIPFNVISQGALWTNTALASDEILPLKVQLHGSEVTTLQEKRLYGIYT